MRSTSWYFPASLSGILLAATSAIAGSDFLTCRQLESDAARLQCYDEAAERVSTDMQSQAEARPKPADKAPTTQPEDLFGKSTEETAALITEVLGVEDVNLIEARVSKIQRDPYDRLFINLDNQQRWKQTGGGRFNLKAGEPIVITRNFFGSFMLEKKSGSPRIRVKRIE
jgi:hypothetical protein